MHEAENPLADYALAEVKISSLKADDGSDLYYRMYKPHDFDSTQKYPVIVYVYGGPGVQLIRNTWLASGNLWFHLMAQKGFIVFTLDNRGTPGRGRAFEQHTFRDLGTIEMQDQLLGVDYLKGLPYVDAERMGVHGWSYGGFMTGTLMTRAPGIFKVGVAGGPVISWDMYEVMYTERYMDTPDKNPEGYKNSDLRNYVKDLEGRLLLIHGTSDDIVVWQHSMSYLKKAIDENVQVDYFVYPGHGHNVLGKDRVHLMEKVTRYFLDFL